MSAGKYLLVFYKDAAKEYRWRVVAPNGEIVGASSEGFSSGAASRENAKLLGQALETLGNVQMHSFVHWVRAAVTGMQKTHPHEYAVLGRHLAVITSSITALCDVPDAHVAQMEKLEALADDIYSPDKQLSD